MQRSYYIFDNEGKVIAIFTSEAFARDYLYHLGLDEDYCRIGILSENVFDFSQHDSKYHTFKDSSLRVKTHNECRRFRELNSDGVGYCFMVNEQVNGYEQGCSMIQVKK